MKKKLIGLIACCFAVFTMVGCDTGDTKAHTPNVTVWTALGTEKIMQGTDYSARHSEKTLTIKAFRNEYESAQIILTPDGEVKSYSVATADLKNAAGEVLPKDCFSIYNQKYVEVTTLKDLNVTTGAGFYPDAILPFDKAVSAGENKVEGGKNQGVWVTVKPSKTQSAGTYTGEFTVTADGKNYKVPVSVYVYDYTLSDVVRSKTSFGIEWDKMSMGEMDSTIEMQEKYYEFFLDYRISPQNFPGNSMVYTTFDEEGLAEFLAYADKYTRDVRCTSYNLPFAVKNQTITTDSGARKTVHIPIFEQYEETLRAMAEYSLENKVNLFKKAQTYFVIYDEYDANGTVDGANYTLRYTYQLYKDLAADMQSLPCDDADLKAEVLHDLANLKDKVVGNLTENLQVPAAQMVPEVMYLHTEEARKRYYDYAVKSHGEEWELWTYTCCFPLNPYPTYHTEDVLVTSRLLNWVMYKYNIIGNLYWTTTLNSWRKNNVNDLMLQDYYDTALRFPSANGDGVLVYPGRPYDIYGPVPTIRLESIRDGQEDYDLLCALEDYYKERGLTGDDFDSVYSLLNSSLISGTAIRHGENLLKNFAESRATLAALLEVASNTGALVNNVQINNDVATVQLSAPETTTLKRNGETLSGTATAGIVHYSLNIPMTQNANYLTISAISNGKSYDLSVYLGGRITMTDGSALHNYLTFNTGAEKSVETLDGVEALALNYQATAGTDFESLGVLSATIDVRSLNITKDMTTLTLNIYSYADEALNFRVRGQSGGGAYEGELENKFELVKGWNTLVISVSSFNIDDALENVQLQVVGTQARKIAIGKITIAG